VLTSNVSATPTWEDPVAGTPATTVATSDASAGVVGTATEYAREDHEHQIVTTGTPTDVTPGDTATAGTANAIARRDHVHGLPDFGAAADTFCEGDDARLTDDRTADGVRTATTIVSVSAASAPGNGDVLTATSSTAATWQAPGSGGGITNTVTGSTGITNVGDNTDADLAPTYGSSANTICEGDDSRLSDARTPTSHAYDSHTGTVPLTDMATGAAGGVIGYAVSTGIATDIGIGTTGQVLTSNAAATATWEDASGGTLDDAVTGGTPDNDVTVPSGAPVILRDGASAITAFSVVKTDTTGTIPGAEITVPVGNIGLSVTDGVTDTYIKADGIVWSAGDSETYSVSPSATSGAVDAADVLVAAGAALGTGTGGDLLLNAGASISGTDGNIKTGSSLYIKEQTAANADVSTYGQLWVSDAATQKLYFTDEAGTDTDLLAAGATSLNSLSDVTLTTPATDAILIKSAGDWIDGQIVEDSIADNAVTLAKMAPGTDGNLISYDTAGDPVAVATGTSGHVLTSNGTGAAPEFKVAAAGGGYEMQLSAVCNTDAAPDEWFSWETNGPYDESSWTAQTGGTGTTPVLTTVWTYIGLWFPDATTLDAIEISASNSAAVLHDLEWKFMGMACTNGMTSAGSGTTHATFTKSVSTVQRYHGSFTINESAIAANTMLYGFVRETAGTGGRADQRASIVLKLS